MATTVAELTPAELRALVAEVVQEQIAALLADPDEGLELREEFVERVRRRRRELEEGAETLTLDEAFAAVESS